MATTDIHAIADRLAEAGQRPTLAAVRKELGGGSFTTISEAMKSWRETQQEEHALGEVQVPDNVSERLSQLQATLWQAAVGEAERRLATERDALAQAKEEAAAAISEAQEAVETLGTEAQEHESQIEQLQIAVRPSSNKLLRQKPPKLMPSKRLLLPRPLLRRKWKDWKRDWPMQKLRLRLWWPRSGKRRNRRVKLVRNRRTKCRL